MYRELASRREGEERDILLALADAEGRHEAHWLALLGGEPARLPRPGSARGARVDGTPLRLDLRARARAERGGSLAVQRRAVRHTRMVADEQIHHEVVRGLASRGRRRLSGTFRAAVFGANDGLVSNLALIIGIGATGAAPQFVLFSGIAGLLAGALSMGAGEFVSVRSQRELLDATEPSHFADDVLPDLDLDANELALVYRTRGMPVNEALDRARIVVAAAQSADRSTPYRRESESVDDHEIVGGAFGAAASSFMFFASGAIIPVLPWIFGLSGCPPSCWLSCSSESRSSRPARWSVSSPVDRRCAGLRQLAIGFGAAAVTYLLGLRSASLWAERG